MSSSLKRLSLLTHFHSKLCPHSLIHIVGNADSRSNFAEVRQQASVQSLDSLCSVDISEQTQGVGLLLGKVEFVSKASLTLELGSDKGKRVGGKLATT